VGVRKEISPRLVDIEFNLKGPALWKKFYSLGKPVQYSYLREDLQLWDQQTLFSGPPVALEPPSASFSLTWNLLFKLQKAGVEVLPLTHATGISNTGDLAIDKQLPFPETYRISIEVQKRLIEAKKEGRALVAVGTGAVRALESWGGKSNSGEWTWTEIKLTKNFKRKIVSGLLTGLHEPEASHLDMLESFAPETLLRKAYEEASLRGYLWHEYGDVCLVR
jgi:S-adenosylmethionine:tRNA ribosyltransferase-isomerase